MSLEEGSHKAEMNVGERPSCMQACQWAIDELKARVPIWKKEFYEGGEVWKENAESMKGTARQ